MASDEERDELVAAGHVAAGLRRVDHRRRRRPRASPSQSLVSIVRKYRRLELLDCFDVVHRETSK